MFENNYAVLRQVVETDGVIRHVARWAGLCAEWLEGLGICFFTREDLSSGGRVCSFLYHALPCFGVKEIDTSGNGVYIDPVPGHIGKRK